MTGGVQIACNNWWCSFQHMERIQVFHQWSSEVDVFLFVHSVFSLLATVATRVMPPLRVE